MTKRGLTDGSYRELPQPPEENPDSAAGREAHPFEPELDVMPITRMRGGAETPILSSSE